MPLADLQRGAVPRAAYLRHDSLDKYGLTGAAAGALQSDLAELISVACALAQADFGAVHVLDAARDTCIAASDNALLVTTPRVRSRVHRVLELVDGPFVTTDAEAEPIFAGLPTDDAESAPIHFYGAIPLIGVEGVPPRCAVRVVGPYRLNQRVGAPSPGGTGGTGHATS